MKVLQGALGQGRFLRKAEPNVLFHCRVYLGVFCFAAQLDRCCDRTGSTHRVPLEIRWRDRQALWSKPGRLRHCFGMFFVYSFFLIWPDDNVTDLRASQLNLWFYQSLTLPAFIVLRKGTFLEFQMRELRCWRHSRATRPGWFAIIKGYNARRAIESTA